MTTTEILSILTCCMPTKITERKCTECPLASCSNCHKRMCEIMMNYVMNVKCRDERIDVELERLLGSLSSLRSV